MRGDSDVPSKLFDRSVKFSDSSLCLQSPQTFERATFAAFLSLENGHIPAVSRKGQPESSVEGLPTAERLPGSREAKGIP